MGTYGRLRVSVGGAVAIHCSFVMAKWPPMKTPRIDRVADLLSNYLKFKVAHLRGAFSLCYIYKDNGGGTASCKLYYIYI